MRPPPSDPAHPPRLASSKSWVRPGVGLPSTPALARSVFKYCSPTRAALLSGRLPYHAHQWNLDAGRAGGTNPKFTLMPAMLKKRGYAAHLVGKW